MATTALAVLAYAIGWLRGGHPERFGVTVLLIDHVVASHVFTWVDSPRLEAAEDLLLLTLFGRFALKGGRWWPLLVAASLGLMVVVHLLTALAPVDRYASRSARLGLWLLIYAAVLGGVGERWLAGERAISEGLRWRERVRPAP